MELTVIARAGQKLELHTQVAAARDQQANAAASVEPVSSYVLSSDGSKIYAAGSGSVDVYSTQAGMQKLGSIPEPGVVLLALSPAGGYLITCQKPGKSEGGEPLKNLKVWDVNSLAQVFSYSLKTVSKDAWPAVSWAADDSCFAVAVPNAAHVFSASNNFASFTKVAIKSLASIMLCPTAQHGRLVAGFIPEAKGSPASTGIYPADSAGEPTPRVKKAFFRTQGAKMMWNCTGTALLVLSFADFDVTNQSYYGEQKLHYLPADPAKADAATTVPLPKEGPVHDVQWSPSGDFFLTVAGFMPAKATLWDANCRPIFDFGSGPYNLVRWNPFGRFIALAGFGNLPGDILFFDKLASGTCKQMGAIRCPAVTADWSPDGRHLLVATTAPRLRVDNRIEVLSYTGQIENTIRFDVLFEASWLPAPQGTYSHRPPSPERLKAGANSLAGSPGGKGGPAATVAAKPAGYVPPHLRGANGAAVGGAPAPSFSLGYDAQDKGGRIQTAKNGGPVVASAAAAAAARRAVPGAEFLGKTPTQQKSKKKNKGDGEAGSSPSKESSSSQQQQQGNQAAEGVSSLSIQGSGGDESADPAKRVRNLQKKLRSIQQLKEKQAAGGTLEPEQIQKIQSEAALIAEIQSLGGAV